MPLRVGLLKAVCPTPSALQHSGLLARSPPYFGTIPPRQQLGSLAFWAGRYDSNRPMLKEPYAPTLSQGRNEKRT
jgi:hypothetical protein